MYIYLHVPSKLYTQCGNWDKSLVNIVYYITKHMYFTMILPNVTNPQINSIHTVLIFFPGIILFFSPKLQRKIRWGSQEFPPDFFLWIKYQLTVIKIIHKCIPIFSTVSKEHYDWTALWPGTVFSLRVCDSLFKTFSKVWELSNIWKKKWKTAENI